MNDSERTVVTTVSREKPARWFRRILRDPQRTRLEEEVQISALRLEQLRATTPGDDEERLDIGDQIAEALNAASHDLRTLDIDGGYANLHLAKELEFGLMSEEELDARTLELRAEAGANRYGKARSAVIVALLDAAGGDVTPPRRRGLTAQAARIALSTTAEKNRRLTILRRHQTILLLIAFVLLAVAAGITFGNTKNFDDLDNWWVAVVAVLLGGLGGVASALQRSTRSGLSGAGERFTSYVVSLSRPLMGAVAGFIAYIGQRVLIEQDGTAQVAAVLVASFAAGFAERLLPVNPDEPATTAPVPVPVTDEG